MRTPPSASPSSQAMNSTNNNHVAQTPELFPSSLSANRYTSSFKGKRRVPLRRFICAVCLSPLTQRSQSEQRPV